jgi:predicted hotdog family 3-hydroxylacyl-ACP dehydratase
MKQTDWSIQDLLPHRDDMLLVHEILEMDENRAVTTSVVTDRWPFFDGKSVSPIVLIELIAQTAGISNGLERVRKNGKDSEKTGWLVGIKKCRFYVDALPMGTKIVTSTEKQFEFDSFREMFGTARIGEHIVCEAGLQVFQVDAQ